MFKPFLKTQQNLAMVMPKKLILLALFIIFYTITHAQYAGWMMGTWKSTSGATTPSGNVTSAIQINDVSEESFTGTKTSEINNGSHAKITIAISGAFRGKGLYMQDGAVVHKEGPENGQWHDCSACSQGNKMMISHDSLILISSISGCDNGCDGETFYYRLLSEYDSSTQQYLVDRFGRPSDIIGFRPYHPQENETIASNDDSELSKNDVVAVTMTPDATAETIKQAEKRHQDSLDNIARIKQQQTDNSIRLAQQKKREQEIADSLNLAQQKEQQRVKDSLDNVARIKQQQLVAATLLAQQKKREQEIADSLNLAQQKEQQRIKDSLDNVARLEQIRLRTEDSLRDVQTKKRHQQIADSLNLVQQKEQQRIKDSLDNAARLAQIKLRTEDSLRDVQAKKRQQQIADSLNLAQQKEQQRIKDSLDNVARIRQQQINDSTLLAQHKKREQEIADSLSLVQQKERQRIKDSLDNAARLAQIRLRTEDSLRNVQVKKRQQEVADSINLVNQRKQQFIQDSLQSVAAANLQKQREADSLRNVQARKRQQEIADSLAAVRKQQYNDSLQKAALAKAVPPATTGSSPSAAEKPLTSRTSVLLGTYHITSPDILIELFDNGEIDGDRVSVYHNNAIIVSNQTLGIKAITLNIHADTTNREHEFVLVAENLGSIPPNSALMRITAGKQIYKLSVNTDMKTNARIVFYYDGN
jgi:hypothetical protein